MNGAVRPCPTSRPTRFCRSRGTQDVFEDDTGSRMDDRCNDCDCNHDDSALFPRRVFSDRRLSRRIDMARTGEVALNGHLAEVLRDKRPLWRSYPGVEQTGVFPYHPRLRPGILVQPPNAQPVAVETEYRPAVTAEDDARFRLGLIPLNSADPIEQASVRVATNAIEDAVESGFTDAEGSMGEVLNQRRGEQTAGPVSLLFSGFSGNRISGG